jgi:hypothetical protein
MAKTHFVRPLTTTGLNSRVKVKNIITNNQIFKKKSHNHP